MRQAQTRLVPIEIISRDLEPVGGYWRFRDTVKILKIRPPILEKKSMIKYLVENYEY